MSYAVVGCSRHGCRNLWVIEVDGATTTSCPRCSRRYNRANRTHLAEAENREEAAEKRAELLRARA